MANQTAATRSKDTASPIAVHKGHHQHIADRANEAVTRRAYALYLASGSTGGQDLAHWLQAESELLIRIPDIRESSSWYTVNVPLHGFAPEQIQVGVDDNQAMIFAERQQATDGQSRQDGAASRESLFLVADWPSTVDPGTASAYVKDENLTLTVKRVESTPAAE